MVKYPKMREELLETLRSLADRDYQHKVWLEGDYPPGIECYSFDEVVHFLYDDTRRFDINQPVFINNFEIGI